MNTAATFIYNFQLEIVYWLVTRLIHKTDVMSILKKSRAVRTMYDYSVMLTKGEL